MLSKMAAVKQYGPDPATNKMINDLLDRMTKLAVQKEKSREAQKKVVT